VTAVGQTGSIRRVVRAIYAVSLGLLATGLAQGQPSGSIPEDFPRFEVPGQAQAMETLRALHWLHYPGSGPKATLWDEWLSAPALWPAVTQESLAEGFRRQWGRALSERILEPDGYVATHQHASIAHQHGWPFPFWHQGQGGAGWHFSFKDTVGPPWRPGALNRPEGWLLGGIRDAGVTEEGWKLELLEPGASVTTPTCDMDTFQAPFLQLRWSATGLGRAQPYLEWVTRGEPEFHPDRRVFFDPVEGGTIVYAMVPMYRHPKWTGRASQLRVGFANLKPGATVLLQALFTQYDTRHNINSQNFVRGCATYFWWTRDLAFLRRNIHRMRLALRYVMTEHQALKRKVVFTDWVGHDGRSGLQRRPDGSKQVLSGHGVGNNYWDLLPFGHLDCYATVHYYDALRCLARLEGELRRHPEWQIPAGVLALDPAMLEQHAAEVKAEGNRLFWNPQTRRFAAGVDADDVKHDFGFTFLNLEAVHYDFATAEHARDIMSWICGERMVAGDTSQGADLYHWRFGPRATTKRNIEWYFWGWNAPETIPWGGQVQDGGAVLGFSYHDLMARLRSRGPDEAWQRLREIIRWFDEVQAAGGYRKYYDGKREGSLQGGGTPGGLGLDHEFFESVLVPQVMLNGFLGFAPAGDGFRLSPQVPTAWPELTVSRIQFQDSVLRIRVAPKAIEVWKEGAIREPLYVHLPRGGWKAVSLETSGALGAAVPLARRDDGAYRVAWPAGGGLRFIPADQ
jgi:hypothetical protein